MPSKGGRQANLSLKETSIQRKMQITFVGFSQTQHIDITTETSTFKK